jgi:hypothetical protein
LTDSRRVARALALALAFALAPLVLAEPAVAVPGDVAPAAPVECLAPSSPTDDAPPVGVATCAPVAPGALFELRNQSDRVVECTFGFAFGGRDGRTYFVAPGACYLEPTCLELLGIELPVCIVIGYNDEEPVFSPGKGIPVRLPRGGPRIGELVYAVYDGTYNLSLLRLDKGVDFSAQVCGVGGPSGIETGITTTPTVLSTVRSGTHHQVVAARGLYDARSVGNVIGLSPTFSGSPVVGADGKAVGMVGYTTSVSVDGGGEVQRLSQPLARAMKKTRLTLQLIAAPVLG